MFFDRDFLREKVFCEIILLKEMFLLENFDEDIFCQESFCEKPFFGGKHFPIFYFYISKQGGRLFDYLK